MLNRLNNKPLFTSDELPHYAKTLGEAFCDIEEIASPKGSGRPPNLKKVIHNDLDYATVHKTRKGAKVIHVERKIIFGTEESINKRLEKSPSKTINTAYIERSNLSWRLWDAHLRRKSSTFAKSMKWLKRLTEPSSYASMAAVLAIVGVNVDVQLLSMIANTGAGIAALVGFFLAEKSDK